MDEIRLNSINSRAPFVVVRSECGTLVSEHQALSEAIRALQGFAKTQTEQPSIYYRLASGWLKLWAGASGDSPEFAISNQPDSFAPLAARR